MNEKDPVRIKKMVEEAEHLLEKFAHPSPYIVPYAPGGTLYQRNLPIPFELTLDEALVDWEAECNTEFENEYAPSFTKQQIFEDNLSITSKNGNFSVQLILSCCYFFADSFSFCLRSARCLAFSLAFSSNGKRCPFSPNTFNK